jgi:hypothetical protein
MAGPSILIDKKLVYPVSSRTIDYGGVVIREWGVEWSKRDIVYEFGNNRKFQDSFTNGGPYKR